MTLFEQTAITPRPILNKVVLTGADCSVSPADLFQIYKKYRFVEWGILFDTVRQANKRYPALHWLHEFHNYHMPSAAHLCGTYVNALLDDGEWYFKKVFDPVASMFKRYQLNFGGKKARPTKDFYKSFQESWLYGRKGYKKIIFQIDGVNDFLFEESFRYGNSNVEGLIDSSYGNGVLPQTWQNRYLDFIYCGKMINFGYAGGLTPDNLDEQLLKISRVCGDHPIWIDVESGIRDKDNNFDIGKAIKFLEIAQKWMIPENIVIKEISEDIVDYESSYTVIGPHGDKKSYDPYGELHNNDGPALEFKTGETIFYKHGKYHRKDGPAVIHPSGKKEYWVDGERHREDGPALEFPDGAKEWWINGKLTKKESVQGNISHHKDGELHNDNGPAVIWKDGSKEYYNNGDLHREDGPAVIFADGREEYYLNGTKLSKDNYLKGQKKTCPEAVINLGKEYGPGTEIKRNVDKLGITYYYKNGKLHNPNGPAIIHPNGTKEYYINGQRHRINGPAIVEDTPGARNEEYFIDGVHHRENGPAVIKGNRKEWWIKGKRHCTSGPAIIHETGQESYYLEGVEQSKLEFMAKNKISEVHYLGVKEHYKNGVLHREDGPAIIYENGQKEWLQNGVHHREDGPAIITNDDEKIYKLYGKTYSEKEYWQRIAELKDLHPLNVS